MTEIRIEDMAAVILSERMRKGKTPGMTYAEFNDIAENVINGLKNSDINAVFAPSTDDIEELRTGESDDFEIFRTPDGKDAIRVRDGVTSGRLLAKYKGRFTPQYLAAFTKACSENE